jgi:PqqD family protein of HPr-rel-A system
VRFQLKQYASEAVAFDTASGDTHYLAPLALALYRIFRDFPGVSRDDVGPLLAQRHALDPGPALDAQIDETLNGLRRIGLIRPE